MAEQCTDRFVGDALTGDERQRALDFFAFLTANGMQFERGNGYWEDKLYWMAKYNDQWVCFILINGTRDENEPYGWTIWTDDSGSNWFGDAPLSEAMKEIAWDNVDICANCGYCGGGTRKTVFGREFDRVCRTAMRFTNPDADALGCLMKLVEIRKNHILKNH